MGIPLEMRDYWVSRRNSFVIPSPSEEQRILNSKNSTREAVIAGSKAASVTAVASSVPVLMAVRWIRWAKANINHTGQALIISSASIAAFVIAADKAVTECARKNVQYDRTA